MEYPINKDRFYREFCRLDFSDSFGIENLKINHKLSWSSLFDQDISGIVSLKLEYKKQGDYFEFPQLPPEINNIIYNFNSQYIIIDIVIVYPLEYPFKSPFWFLGNVNTNLADKLYEYYNYKLDLHNKSIGDQFWCPAAMSMDKDILTFISNISDFQEIVNLF